MDLPLKVNLTSCARSIWPPASWSSIMNSPPTAPMEHLTLNQRITDRFYGDFGLSL